MEELKRKAAKPKAVIVGGSIAGVSCAHALTTAGWDVVVLEKTAAPPTVSLTGAGLGLEPLAQRIIASWLPGGLELLRENTIPLTIDQNQMRDEENKTTRILSRDEELNFLAAHWADLHRILYQALSPDIFLWGHFFLSFSVADDKTSVRVKTQVLKTGETMDIVCDLLIAADGCLSSIRRTFLPDRKLRYSGYCAWRGVLDFSNDADSETIKGLKKAYPDLGKCLYFELGSGAHCVLYELLNNKINWISYVCHPEPELKASSVTMKVSSSMIRKMHEEAEKIRVPELVRVIKETKEPFLNFIYDCDPLEQLFWDGVVLIGDAAHATTPHGLRSTNMSIVDAAVLGKCLQKWGVEKLYSALQEYQSIRLPATSKQVLHSRKLGCIKQGLFLPERQPFDPKTASPEHCLELEQKNMPFFATVPSILM